MSKSYHNLKSIFCTFIVLNATVTFNYTEGSVSNQTKECVLRLTSDFYSNKKDIPLLIHFEVRVSMYIYFYIIFFIISSNIVLSHTIFTFIPQYIFQKMSWIPNWRNEMKQMTKDRYVEFDVVSSYSHFKNRTRNR